VRCALVDVDRTLVDATSCERLFLRRLMRERLVGPGQLARATRFALRWCPRYGSNVWKKNKAYLAGLEVEAVADLAARFVDNEVVPLIRPVMRRRLEAHRANGEPVALLTGAPDFIAAPLARIVGADTCAATVCISSHGRFTDAPPARHPFREDKLVAARILCDQLGTRLSACTAYGDSVDDIPLLHAVGAPVAVFPDRGLRRFAERAGWEIIAG